MVTIKSNSWDMTPSDLVLVSDMHHSNADRKFQVQSQTTDILKKIDMKEIGN